MKTIFSILFLISAFAVEARPLNCSSSPSNERSQVDIIQTGTNDYTFIVKVGTRLQGRFAVKKDPKSDYYFGRGILNRSSATVQGSFTPIEGQITVSLYSPDRNIDMGYGVHLACKL